MNDWMNERMNEWMNGWMSEWTNEWVNERMSQYGSLVKFVLRAWRITLRDDTLSTADLTWTDLGANPGLRGENPATMIRPDFHSIPQNEIMDTHCVYRLYKCPVWRREFVSDTPLCSWLNADRSRALVGHSENYIILYMIL